MQRISNRTDQMEERLSDLENRIMEITVRRRLGKIFKKKIKKAYEGYQIESEKQILRVTGVAEGEERDKGAVSLLLKIISGHRSRWGIR